MLYSISLELVAEVYKKIRRSTNSNEKGEKGNP